MRDSRERIKAITTFKQVSTPGKMPIILFINNIIDPEAEISTFGVYVDEICEGIKTNADDRPYLVMQKVLFFAQGAGRTFRYLCAAFE